MNSWIISIYGHFLFGLFSSSINWYHLHWGSHVSHYCCIFLSKLFPKMFKPLHFPLMAFVYITGLNAIRNVHLDDFSQESWKNKNAKRKKKLLNSIAFIEGGNHIFWIGLSFLFICLLFALLTDQPISFAYVKWSVSSRYGGRLCRDTRSQTHTQECDRRYKIIINLSGKYGRPLCRNACGEDCRTFPHSTNVSPVISY